MSHADQIEAMEDACEIQGDLCPQCGKARDPRPHYCDSDDVYVHARAKLHEAAEKVKMERDCNHTVYETHCMSGIRCSLCQQRIIDRQANRIQSLEKNLHEECALSAQTIKVLQERVKAKDEEDSLVTCVGSERLREIAIQTWPHSCGPKRHILEMADVIDRQAKYIVQIVRAAQLITKVKEWAGTMPEKYRYYGDTLDERIGTLERALKQ